MADVLLDTEVVSVLTSTKSHVRPLKEAIEERIIDFDWVLCSVVVAELIPWRRGIGNRRANLLDAMLSRLPSYAMTDSTAHYFASIEWDSAPSASDNDRWIASCAEEHNMLLATCDSDFLRVPHIRERLLYFDKPNILKEQM